MKSAIVTGATGFVGSWLIEKLLHTGIQVTALAIEEGTDVKGSIKDYIEGSIETIYHKPGEISSVAGFIKSADVFYNLGWGGVAPEHKNNLDIQMANIRFAVEAVQLAANIGCKRFIGIGSAAEYVYSKELIESSQPPTPSDLYGAAKVSARFMSQQLSNLLGLRFNWVILPSTFGPRRNDDNIITYTIRSLLDEKRPSYTKCEQMWDFLYIKDVVNALYLIGEKGIPGKTYGVGSGVYRPLYEYIEIIRDMINPCLPLGIGDRPYPQGIVPGSCIDIFDLVMDTGYKPEVSFEKGIGETIRYFKGQFK